MAIRTRIPLDHLSHDTPQYSIIRRTFSRFHLPAANGMREPGTHMASVQTAEGQAWLDLSK